ncbi:MAG: glycosyltransferase family A protein [Planctomycetota bacterium]
MAGSRYCLITPARNEAAHLARTADAVAAQTAPPLRWVIVDDGSDDDTGRIAEEYAARVAFVSVVRRPVRRPGPAGGGGAGFASKVFAFERGRAELGALAYDFVGNLDADVSFGPRFFERLLAEFGRDPSLGVAGGWVREPGREGPRPRFGNAERDVAGAVQLFRRACFDGIGGFPPLECGGEDAAAQAMARMRGWRVMAFPHLVIDHHRPAPRGVVSGGAARFREGVRDRALGYHPVFEVLKCVRRAAERPYLVGAAMRLAGYAWSCLGGGAVGVPPDVARFVRGEQLRRVRALFSRETAAAGNRR